MEERLLVEVSVYLPCCTVALMKTRGQCSTHCSAAVTGKYFKTIFFRSIKTQEMSLRGFSAFEASFRAKMAQSASTRVWENRKMKAVLTEREREEYRQTFKKFDTDGSNTIDTQELGQMIRVLGSVSA